MKALKTMRTSGTQAATNEGSTQLSTFTAACGLNQAKATLHTGGNVMGILINWGTTGKKGIWTRNKRELGNWSRWKLVTDERVLPIFHFLYYACPLFSGKLAADVGPKTVSMVVPHPTIGAVPVVRLRGTTPISEGKLTLDAFIARATLRWVRIFFVEKRPPAKSVLKMDVHFSNVGQPVAITPP